MGFSRAFEVQRQPSHQAKGLEQASPGQASKRAQAWVERTRSLSPVGASQKGSLAACIIVGPPLLSCGPQPLFSVRPHAELHSLASGHWPLASPIPQAQARFHLALPTPAPPAASSPAKKHPSPSPHSPASKPKPAPAAHDTSSADPTQTDTSGSSSPAPGTAKNSPPIQSASKPPSPQARHIFPASSKTTPKATHSISSMRSSIVYG